jgi:hypothetical protein
MAGTTVRKRLWQPGGIISLDLLLLADGNTWCQHPSSPSTSPPPPHSQRPSQTTAQTSAELPSPGCSAESALLIRRRSLNPRLWPRGLVCIFMFAPHAPRKGGTADTQSRPRRSHHASTDHGATQGSPPWNLSTRSSCSILLSTCHHLPHLMHLRAAHQFLSGTAPCVLDCGTAGHSLCTAGELPCCAQHPLSSAWLGACHGLLSSAATTPAGLAPHKQC